MIQEHWKPIRKEVMSGATDPHFAGNIVLEISPEGITWWWAGREDQEPDGHLTYADLVIGAFLDQEAEVQEEIDYARAHLDLARKLVAKADKQLSFKVVE